MGVIYIDGVPEEFTGRLWDYRHRRIHREDGPAVEYANGDVMWYLHGLCHRADGPAIERANCAAWYRNGIRHREDGPAIIWTDESKEWYLNGNRYGFEEFLRRLPKEDAVLVALTWR
jgi:hypothetical protein